MAEIDTQNQITQTGENFHTGQLLKNPYEIHTFRRAYQKVLDSMEYGSYDTGKGYNNLKKRKRILVIYSPIICILSSVPNRTHRKTD